MPWRDVVAQMGEDGKEGPPHTPIKVSERKAAGENYACMRAYLLL